MQDYFQMGGYHDVGIGALSYTYVYICMCILCVCVLRAHIQIYLCLYGILQTFYYMDTIQN